MYYNITSNRDINRILKKHPMVSKSALTSLVYTSILTYGDKGAIYISKDSRIEYSSLEYYKQCEPEYGTLVRSTKEVKYNKYMLKGAK